MTMEPSCGAVKPLRAPWKDPTGVRQAETMTRYAWSAWSSENGGQLFMRRRNSLFDFVPRIFSSRNSIDSTGLNSASTLRSTRCGSGRRGR